MRHGGFITLPLEAITEVPGDEEKTRMTQSQAKKLPAGTPNQPASMGMTQCQRPIRMATASKERSMTIP